jgi:hypothetical protein
MIEFFIGFLYKAIIDRKPLRPLASIREERNAVIHSGYNAKTHFDVTDTAKSQIHTAKQGLAELGLGSEFIKILETRLNNKTSPALYVSRLWESKYNGDVSQTVSEIVQHVWEKTRNNIPLL